MSAARRFERPIASPYQLQEGMVLLLAVVMLTIGFPLLLSQYDFWDGRIIDHAFATNQSIGVVRWFTDSGWPLQHMIFSAVQQLSGTIGLSGQLILKFVSIGSLIGVVYEAVRLAQDVLKMPRQWAILAGLAVSVFPAWSALFSSVLFMYILCAWLGLIGVRLIHQKSKLAITIGVALLIPSFTMASNFVFAIALAASHLSSAWVYQRHISRGAIARFAFVTGISITSFIFVKATINTYDHYADYNQIDTSDPAALLLQLIKGTIGHLQYPVVLAIVLLGVYFVLELIARNIKAGNQTEAAIGPANSIENDSRKLVWPIIVAGFLVGAAIFPYVAVGKSADLFTIFDWSQRHVFLMSVPIGIFIAGFARLLCEWPNWRRSPYWYVPILAPIILMAAVQLTATWSKLSRSAYEAGMVAALKNSPAPEPGVVKMIAPGLEGHWLRFYETNWLLFEAYGREDWYSGLVIEEADEMVVNDWVENNDTINVGNRSKFIMRTYTNVCQTDLKFSGRPFSALEVIGWMFGVDLPDTVSLKQQAVRCTKERDVGLAVPN